MISLAVVSVAFEVAFDYAIAPLMFRWLAGWSEEGSCVREGVKARAGGWRVLPQSSQTPRSAMLRVAPCRIENRPRGGSHASTAARDRLMRGGEGGGGTHTVRHTVAKETDIVGCAAQRLR
eukprot:GHVU01176183.1.p2 GENE.GHVU01176183.1~~GHVU01176183.1.p2  ORF type:complete len:121 (+),score=9.59 GHVU01176183.1:94-456(+)